jgi:hypothetical protein
MDRSQPADARPGSSGPMAGSQNSMNTHVEFRSNAFPPYDGEEDQINPGRYGKRLAEFLIRGLKEKGLEPLDPIAEDWGWVIPIKDERFNLWIGCGNYDEYPDGFLCFIEPHRPVIRPCPFLWKVDTSDKATTGDRRGAFGQSSDSRQALVDLRGVQPGWEASQRVSRAARIRSTRGVCGRLIERILIKHGGSST